MYKSSPSKFQNTVLLFQAVVTPIQAFLIGPALLHILNTVMVIFILYRFMDCICRSALGNALLNKFNHFTKPLKYQSTAKILSICY